MATGVELATAWVRLVPSMEGAEKEITKSLEPTEKAAEESGKRSGGRYSKALGVAAVAAGAAIAAGFVKVFNVGLEELKFGEELNAQTDILVKNTGFAMSTDKINDYTLALSKVSGISEEDLQSAGNAILKFGDISEENYKKSVDAINNMGAAGKDVAGTSEALGKALADPAKAASQLRRQGVMLTDEQKNMIATMTEAGDKAGAQGVILDALEDTYGGMAEKTGGTLQGNLNKLNNNFENMAGDLVSTLMPALTGLVAGLDGFVTWLSDNQQLIPVFIGVLGFLALAFVGVTVATWAMNTALLANPITWIILGIVALIAALVLLVMNWDTVAKWISDVWGGFIGWITGITDTFVTWWNGMWAGFGSWVSQVWSGFVAWITTVWSGFVSWLFGIGASISSWWNGLWSGIGTFVQQAWNNIVNFVALYIATLLGIVRNVGATISGVWSGIWNGITSFFSRAWSGIIATVQGVGTTFNNIFKGIAGFVTTAFQGVVGAVKGPVNGIIGIVNGAIRSLNKLSVTIPAWVPLVGGQTWGLSLPTIPSLAKGATINPTAGGTLVRVAEAGKAESVVDTGKVNQLIEEALTGGNGETNVTVINKTGVSLEEFVEIIIEKDGKKRRIDLENGVRL